MNTNTIIGAALCSMVPLAVAGAALVGGDFFGHAAKRELRSRGSARNGRANTAAAVLTLGYLELALLALVIFGGGHRPSRVVAYEAMAVGSLRTPNSAPHAYARVHPETPFPKGSPASHASEQVK